MPIRKTFRVLPAAMLALGLALPAKADPEFGAYLAARQAEMAHDYRSAAAYAARALVQDPTNTALLESALISNISLGQTDQIIALAQLLNRLEKTNQIANMALVAHSGATGAYGDILTGVETGNGVGPLVDGLVVAWADLGNGRMSEALAKFDEVAAEPGLGSFGLYHKALALASVGDFEGADEIFSGRSGTALPPTRRGIEAHVRILTQLERSEDALILIDEVFGSELDPGLAKLRADVAAGAPLPLSQVRSAQDGLAEVFYSVAGALDGEADDHYTLLYARLAEYLKPDHVDAVLLSASLLERLGRPELATEAYDRIPAGDPAFLAAELGRAEALRQSGNLDGAIEALRQLAKTYDDQSSIFVTLGDYYRRDERYSEAVTAYDNAIARFGEPAREQWPIYFARGTAHERLQDWDKSEADMRRALELEPGQPQVLNYLGYTFLENGVNFDEAMEMIRAAVEARPNDGYITDSLGWGLYRLGEYDEAVMQMELAVELMPVDPIITDHLGDVYWAVGRIREAKFQWRRALSFDPEEKDAARIRRKLEVGLDAVLAEEGAPPLKMAEDKGQ